MLSKRNIIPLLALFFLCTAAAAQNGVIRGIVTDEEQGDPLIGVRIVMDSASGAESNWDGKYAISAAPGPHSLVFTYGDFKAQTHEVNVVPGDTLLLNVILSYGNSDMDIVVISGSQYEKKIAEETVSIDVVKPYLIENNNSPDLSDAVRKVPGVAVTDGQASIRGGAGYSYGAGTRVQMLVDGMPLIAADLGDIWWNFIPIEIAEQVEVIKGASSVMYGSGALNGVIHLRTGYARKDPETKIQLYQGIYANPRRPEPQWWELNSQPNFSGGFFSHRRRLGNLDIVAGGHLNNEQHYLQSGDNFRGRFALKTRYRPEKVPGLSFGLNGSAMYTHFGRFILWQDKDLGAYKPYGSTFFEKYSLYTLDPWLSYVGPKGFSHNFKGRFYNVRKKLESEENGLDSQVYYARYQGQKRFNNGLSVTAGGVGQITNVLSNLFDPDSLQRLGTFFGAGFLQADKKFGERLSAVAGVRYEYNSIIGRDPEPSRPVFRTGLNYKAAEFTFIRGSWGQGYRFPSLGERFTATDFAGLFFFPNPDLKPESGWTGELGIKQGLKIGDWQGFADLAVFWTEFNDMTEFLFTIQFDAQGNPQFGFQNNNVGRSRIAGSELTLMGEGKLFKVPFRIFTGFTYNYPGSIESDTTQKNIGTYLGNLFGSIGGVDSTFAANSMLKYRFRNLGTFDAEFDVNRFTFGCNVAYNSFMDNIDEYLTFLLPSIAEFRKENPKGSTVLNLRGSWHINETSTVTLIAKNATNREYDVRPGMMGAPANFTVQYRVKF